LAAGVIRHTPKKSGHGVSLFSGRTSSYACLDMEYEVRLWLAVSLLLSTAL